MFVFFLSGSSENPCDNEDTITIETQNEDGAILDSEEETTISNETISVHEKANENKSTSDTLAPPEKLKAPCNMNKGLLNNLQTKYGWLEIKNDAFLCKLCSTLSGGIPSDIQSCRGFWVNKPVLITDHFHRSVLNHQHSNLHKANEKLLKELKRLKLTKKGGIGAQILAGSLKEKE